MAFPSNGKDQTSRIPPDEDDSIEFEGLELTKPCEILEYCPYGPLVEEFPLLDTPDDMSCRIFGHQCPVFYTAEGFVESMVTKEPPSTFMLCKRCDKRIIRQHATQLYCKECGIIVKRQKTNARIAKWRKGKKK